MLKFLYERQNEYSTDYFVNELADSAKLLGILEGKIGAYQFNSILVPLLNKREAMSSMSIEGTQTTFSDVLENEISPKPANEKIAIEVKNHTRALIFGSEHLCIENFTHSFIRELHKIMMQDIISKDLASTLGKYKTNNNHIANSSGDIIFIPPTATETQKYMDELISFINDETDGIHPLIKAALFHSQFESIHPFSDGNGRVGRLLISLYLYKTRVINVPFFYISEAINQDKSVYYNMLTNSRESNYNEWIKYFLRKIIVQTKKLTTYIDSLNALYKKTKKAVQRSINSTKFDNIIAFIFTHPVLNSTSLSEYLSVSRGQALRYLNTLENEHILYGNDKQRNRFFYFSELLDLAQGILP